MMFDRLTPEEETEYLRLHDKLLGGGVVEEGVNASEEKASRSEGKPKFPSLPETPQFIKGCRSHLSSFFNTRN